VNNIHIYDISNSEKYRSIAYINKGKITVKISDDFSKVVFSNGIEYYILKEKS